MNKFISYAPNLEDVMLWRALEHVPGGVYLDVGAHHPTYGSITKSFYLRGWSGINVEPLSKLFNLLVQDRKRDINLECAVASQSGEIVFYEIPERGWGLSTGDRTILDKHLLTGEYTYIKNKVVTKTLTEICDEFELKLIHFLKIDVEGMEKQVLEGFNLSMFRPWIILLEATEPDTQIPSYESWEYLLINNNYSFVYFDGLNRFYIANEHSELKKAFLCPPNVFDNYITFKEYELEQCVQAAQEYAKQAEQAEQAAQECAKQAEQAEQAANQRAKQAELYADELTRKSKQIKYLLKVIFKKINNNVKRLIKKPTKRHDLHV